VEAAQQSLPGCSPGRVEVAELDLNSLASVRRCGGSTSQFVPGVMSVPHDGRSLVRHTLALRQPHTAKQSLGCTTCHTAVLVMIAWPEVDAYAAPDCAARFVARFAARRLALSLLVCNAGIMGGPRRTTTDGLEMQFQVLAAPLTAASAWLCDTGMCISIWR